MPARKTPLFTKILYGIGDVAVNIKTISLNQFLLFFYVDIMRAGPELIGAALFVGKIWDGVTDPLVGYFSDTTRSRWGRRRPYVLLSALPLGLCYYLIFVPPQGGSNLTLFAYLVITYIALDTFFTAFATPYMAWGAELADDYHERTIVVQVRAVFGVIGGIIGSALPVYIAQRFSDQHTGFARMAIVLGVLMSLTALTTGVCVRDAPPRQVASASMRHFFGGLRGTFTNRAFTIVFVTFCLMTIASALGQSIQLIVWKYRLDMYDFFPVIALTYALSFAASFPIWLAVSRRIGKHRGLLLGLLISCVTPFGWLVVQPGQHGVALLFMVAAGLTAGSLTLAVSQAADVIDLDELATGEKRAGSYFGIWTLGLKAMNAVGTLLGGLLLSLVGYVPQATQDPATLWWLVMLLGPLQAVVHLVGFLIFRRLRFGGEDVARVQEALKARQVATT